MSNERKNKIKKINEDPDYIEHPKFSCSIKKLLDKYPDGVDDDTIAKILLMDKSEVEAIYQESIKKIRKKLGVE